MFYPQNNRTKPEPSMQNKKIYCSLIIFNKVNLGNFDSLYQKNFKSPQFIP